MDQPSFSREAGGKGKKGGGANKNEEKGAYTSPRRRVVRGRLGNKKQRRGGGKGEKAKGRGKNILAGRERGGSLMKIEAGRLGWGGKRKTQRG